MLNIRATRCLPGKQARDQRPGRGGRGLDLVPLGPAVETRLAVCGYHLCVCISIVSLLWSALSYIISLTPRPKSRRRQSVTGLHIIDPIGEETAPQIDFDKDRSQKVTGN
jgi:hypothetical protein